MSDRTVPAYQRRGAGNLRGQVLETMIQSASGLDPDLWVVMDQRDNTLIEEEILHGAGSSKYVYQFSLGGTQVSGISVIGARELAASYGGIQHSLIGSISKVGSLFVMKSYPHAGQSMGLFVQQINELAGEPDYYEVLAEIKDVKTGNAVQIEKKELRLERRSATLLEKNPSLPEWFERPHYQTIAGSKAYRNGVLSIIPQHVQLEWKQEMLKLAKTDIITQSLVDEKRSGVLRYAASKAISVDRQAIEALTLDQIMGLADAVKEGRVEQFAHAAEALGIVIGAEVEKPTRTQVAAKLPHATSTPPTPIQTAQNKEAPKQAEPKHQPKQEDRVEEKSEEVKAEKEDEPKQEDSAFLEYPLDEFGDPFPGTGRDGFLSYTSPGAFAQWYNQRYFVSPNKEALRQNNQDACDLASSMDNGAKVLIDAANAPIDVVKEREEAKAKEVAEEKPKGWVAMTSLPNGRPNWQKYVLDCTNAMKDTIKTIPELEDWITTNIPGYRAKPWEVKIEPIIAARRAQINRAPEDIDLKRTQDLVSELEGVQTVHEYNAIIARETTKTLARRLTAERPELRKMVADADTAAKKRTDPKPVPEKTETKAEPPAESPKAPPSTEAAPDDLPWGDRFPPS